MHAEAEPLRAYMSELSEAAYYAGWMLGLEYALWSAVLTGPLRYGHLQITEEHIARLRELSRRCGGWVAWDDRANEERFVPAGEWARLYATRTG